MSGRASDLTGRALRIMAIMALALSLIPAWALPAMAQDFSVQFGAQEFDVCPGDRFSGSIPVTNTSENPVTVRIFTGDWVRIPGQGDYAATEGPGDEPRSLITWMSFSPDSMTLQPGESRNITFEVNVPDDWTLSGSYWDLIYVQGVPLTEPGTEEPDSEQAGIGIRTVFRYVIRVMATIQDTGIRSATFSSLNFEPLEGGFKAIARFRNDGNTFIKPTVWIELRDPAGATVYTEEHIVMTVLPESERDFVFELRNLPIESGDYLVMVIADYGAQNLIAARGRLSLTITHTAEEGEAAEGGEDGATGEGESGTGE